MRYILSGFLYLLTACQQSPEKPLYTPQEVSLTQLKLKELGPTLQQMDQENLKDMKSSDVENILKNLDHFIQATCNSTKEAPSREQINQRAKQLKLEFTEGMEHIPALVSVDQDEIKFFPENLECRGELQVKIEAFQYIRKFQIPLRPTSPSKSFWMEGL